MPTLQWLSRDEDLRAAARVPYRLLDPEQDMDGGAADTGNMLIQGDNLDALKSLLPFYAGKVKCIYIDPPYNTGSAFEHYDDNLEHSQWLAMMWPRLELLRDLLSEDGSIWVSCDDREGHYLKVVMDEVFGRKNFKTSFIWQKSDSPNDNKVPITPDHEFLHCYEKKSGAVQFRQKSAPDLLDAYKTSDDEPRHHRDRLLKKNGKNSLREDRPTMWYELTAPDGSKVLPKHDDGREANWAFSKAGVKKLREENRLIWKNRGSAHTPRWVPYSREFAPENPTRPHPTILLDVKTTRQAKAHARNNLPKIEPIDTIKPEQIIERVLEIATNPGDLVLDSFLGSGTTAAVAHKMGRRWIGIEMGDHARTHCVPRLRKVIEGEQGGISEAVGWNGGGGYRFYTLGERVFGEDGRIRDDVPFSVLAAHIWFAETRTPLSSAAAHAGTPFLGHWSAEAGKAGEHGLALLYNGILGDKSVSGGNVLIHATLAAIRSGAREFDGPLTVYGERSALSPATLAREGITFKQTPYDVAAVRS